DHGEVVLRSIHHPNPSRAPARVAGELALMLDPSCGTLLSARLCCLNLCSTLRLHLNVITISSSCGGSDPTSKSQVRQEVAAGRRADPLRILMTIDGRWIRGSVPRSNPPSTA